MTVIQKIIQDIELLSIYYHKLMLDIRLGNSEGLSTFYKDIEPYIYLFDPKIVDDLHEFSSSNAIQPDLRRKSQICLSLLKQYVVYMKNFADYVSILSKPATKRCKIQEDSKNRLPLNQALNLVIESDNWKLKTEAFLNYSKSFSKLIPNHGSMVIKLREYVKSCGFTNILAFYQEDIPVRLSDIKEIAEKILNDSRSMYDRLKANCFSFINSNEDILSSTEFPEIVHYLKIIELYMLKIFKTQGMDNISEEISPKLVENNLTLLFQNLTKNLGLWREESPLNLVTASFYTRQATFCSYQYYENPPNVDVHIVAPKNLGSFRSFFHESGHGIHLANIDQSFDIIFRIPSDLELSESFSYLFELLLQNETFLESQKQILEPLLDANFLEKCKDREKPFFEVLREIIKFNKLNIFRNHALMFLYWYDIFSQTEDYEKGYFKAYQTRVTKLYEKYFGYAHTGYKFLQDFLQNLFCPLHYFMGEINARVITKNLQEDFGTNWWKTKEAGTWLKTTFFENGFKKSFWEVAQELGYFDGRNLNLPDDIYK